MQRRHLYDAAFWMTLAISVAVNPVGAHPLSEYGESVAAALGSDSWPADNEQVPNIIVAPEALSLIASHADGGRYATLTQHSQNLDESASFRRNRTGAVHSGIPETVTGLDNGDRFGEVRNASPVAEARGRSDRGSSLTVVSRKAPDGEMEQPVLAELGEVQQWLVDLIVDALEVKKSAPDGRFFFSIAGVDGFHFKSGDNETSLGYGDSSLSIVTYDPRVATRSVEAAKRQAGSDTPPPRISVVDDILQFAKDVVQFPLVWVFAISLAIGKLALRLVGSRSEIRPARSSGNGGGDRPHGRTRARKRSRSSPPTPQERTNDGALPLRRSLG